MTDARWQTHRRLPAQRGPREARRRLPPGVDARRRATRSRYYPELTPGVRRARRRGVAAASTSASRTARRRSPRSTSRSRGRVRDAARPVGLRQVDAAQSGCRPARRPRTARSAGGAGRWRRRAARDAASAIVFQSPTLMPWARVDANVRLPLDLAHVPRARSRTRGRRRAGARRPRAVRAPSAARAVRRHADARLDRARARHLARPPADGRAVRRARRVHAAAARRRAFRAVARARADGRVRDPQHRRGGLPVDARRGHGGATGPRARRRGDRRARSRAATHGACRQSRRRTRSTCPSWSRTPTRRAPTPAFDMTRGRPRIASAALRRAGDRRARRDRAVAGADHRIRGAVLPRALAVRRRAHARRRSRAPAALAAASRSASRSPRWRSPSSRVRSRRCCSCRAGWIEMSLFPYAVLLQVTPIVAIAPLIIIWVKDARIGAGAVRGRRRDLPDHLEHDARAAQRRSGPARPVPHEPRDALADAGAAAHPERAALFLRRAAHRERPGADRRRRRRVRRRHRRQRRRPRLPDPACRHPAQHSAALRRAGADRRHRRRAVRPARCGCRGSRFRDGTKASSRCANEDAHDSRQERYARRHDGRRRARDRGRRACSSAATSSRPSVRPPLCRPRPTR